MECKKDMLKKQLDIRLQSQNRKIPEDFMLDIQAQISSANITAIFGPSGAGKTTLLRCIAGLQKDIKGDVVFAGDVWQSQDVFTATHQRQIGYVFQEPGIFPHLNVAENLTFASRRSFSTCNDNYQQQVIETLEIESLLQQSAASLSGGERQRVAIARALMSRPRLLLLDEPLSALDESRKRRILQCLKEVHADLHIPMLYVSHQRDEVIQLADDVLLLERGKVKATGTPAHIFATTGEPEQKESILTGVVKRVHSDWQLVEFDCGGVIIWLQDKNYEETMQLRIRVLPKDVSVSLTEDVNSSMLNRVVATISAIEESPDSASAMLTLDLAGNRLFSLITRFSLYRLKLTLGMSVWAQIKSIAVLSQ